jgi:GntR family transcriptional regulator, vanillate catabolism transcriptional regulator
MKKGPSLQEKPNMSKIEYFDLSYQVYLKIKELILEGQFKPGEKLLQEKIAQMLGVSRTPLHKAFQMLEDEFLVESVPRRGIFVRKVDIDEILDTFECREVLEGLAAFKVAARISKQEIQQLREIFEPFMDQDNFELDPYHSADRKFHHDIIAISGNKVLTKMEILSNVMHKTNYHGMFRLPNETLPEHLDIIDAFANKQSRKAEELMREHLHKTIVAIKIKFKYQSPLDAG